jgi:3-hydroxyisobutyrate dehydrogenase-like beta-hydroxyacid dehydrogenase
MGSAVVSRLLVAGYAVRVWNRSRQPVEAIVARGAVGVASAAEAADADVLCCMLADDAAIRSAILDAGVLEHAKPGLVFANHATVSVAFARELADRCAERGIDYVAAPVLGRPEAAAQGKLHIFAAGKPDAIARVRPVLEAMSQRVWPLGEDPQPANAAKLASNFMIASTIEQLGEAIALVEKYGVSASELVELLTGTSFGSPIVVNYGRRVAEQSFSPAGFTMTLGAKDLRLVLAAGEEKAVAMPFASVLRDRFLEGIARGDSDLDWSAIAKR